MITKEAEHWFEGFKAEADAFDIYGAGCAASNYYNQTADTQEEFAWAEIIFHCKEIERHIDAIRALEMKFK